MSNEQTEFAEFFRVSWEPCLRAVVTVAGSPQLAEDQLAEAFAKPGRRGGRSAVIRPRGRGWCAPR